MADGWFNTVAENNFRFESVIDEDAHKELQGGLKGVRLAVDPAGTVASNVPADIRPIFEDGLFEKIFLKDHYVSRIVCRKFYPGLYALFITDERSDQILESEELQGQFSRWMKSDGDRIRPGDELAFILYAPYHRSDEPKTKEERPTAIFARNMNFERRELLVETVMEITGVRFRVTKQISGISVYLTPPGSGEPLYGPTLRPVD